VSCDQATYLGDLSQSSSLLSEVDDNTAATILCLFDGFFDTKDQVRTASADIRSEHVATVALQNTVSSGSYRKSENYTSSWIRRDSRTDSSDILAGSPKQYTVRPPIGGRNTLMSPRVISLAVLAVRSSSTMLAYLWVASTCVLKQGTSKGGLVFVVLVVIQL
jgi:hypothetical protein